MAEFELDCLGEACPIPLVKTENKMKELEVGDTLIVIIDHSCALKNVPEWARKNSYDVEVEEVGESEWEIFIDKTA